MADQPGRTTDDIHIVRDIAAKVGDVPGEVPPTGVKSFTGALKSRKFGELLKHVEEAVADGSGFLSSESRERLARSFANGLRVFAFYERIGSAFVLALRGMKNVYEAGVIIDIFNPRALEGLGLDAKSPPPPPFDNPEAWPDFRPLIGRLEEQTKVVTRVDRKKASVDFVTLFVDTLRALARGSHQKAAIASPPATTAFTVHSGPKNMGYQLSYFPQYRYSPVVFGSTLSTPVVENIATGHWCFEGRQSGATAPPIRDPGVHFAGPSRNSTTTTAF